MVLASVIPILPIAGWVALAVVLSFLGLLVLRRLRSWSRREDTPQMFTIQDLRQMNARGEISDAEFESMRAALLARFAKEPPKPDSGGTDDGESPASPSQPQ